MNQLIKVVEMNNKQVVSGRELHEFLEVETPYSMWMKRMTEYGFEEEQDFITFLLESNGGRPKEEHQLTIEMAKEIAMIQRSEKGKQARLYFIKLEKFWNSPEMVMKRALEFADGRIKELELTNEVKDQVIGELKPKAEYVDRILKSKALVTMTQIAQDYGLTANKLNSILKDQGVQRKVNTQWVLYQKHISKGYTQSETMEIYNKRTGKNQVVMNTMWTQKGRLFIHTLLQELGIKAILDQEN